MKSSSTRRSGRTRAVARSRHAHCIVRAAIERLESRRLLSATFSLTPLAGVSPGLVAVFNDAGQIAGTQGEAGFLYSKGKLSTFQPANEAGVQIGGMNASGQIVGTLAAGSTGNSEAFLYSGGKLTPLGYFGGIWSSAVAINNAGVIAGNYETSAGFFRGFIYSAGKMTDIGTLGGSSTTINALNNNGQATGYSDLPSGGHTAFLYGAGKITDIDPLDSNFGIGADINDAGQVIGRDGTAAFFYSAGKTIHLQLTPGGSSEANVINAAGEVAGHAVNAHGHDDLFTYVNGVMKDDGGIPGETFTVAGINNSGALIGYYADNSDTQTAFLYENGAIQTLNYDQALEATVDFGFGPETETLSNFDAINNSGQIVADDGVNAYLLTPASPASVSGTVFNDVNADGKQQSTESGLSGRMVYDDVYNTGTFADGDPETTTNAAGHYALSNLPPGPHVIRFQPPTTNWKQSVVNLTLSSGQNMTTANFATLPLYSFKVTDLGTLGGSASNAVAINNAGQVIGESLTTTGVDHPFLYTLSTGKMTDLSSVLGAKALVSSINDLGQIVGTVPNGKLDSDGQPATQGFVYSGGKLTLLPLPADSEDGSALGINDKGQIVATANTFPDGLYQFVYTNAFLYSATTGKLVGGIPQEYSDIGALAINNSDQIFENSFYPPFKSPGFAASFLYSGNQLIPLPTAVSAPGPWFGSPIDVALGNTVYAYDHSGDSLGSEVPATFYSGRQAVALNETLPADSHWSLDVAGGINASNMIVGEGTNPQGNNHAYLLTPVLASISGTVFNDANGDGAKQTTDAGLVGWTVYADVNGNGKLDTGEPSSITDATGHYSITGLSAGGFTIRVVAKTGYHQTAPAVISQTLVAAGQTVTGPSFGEAVVGPYGGKIPAFTTIQAENFDLGGQNTGYFDPGNTNRGGLYRPLEGVGIGAIPSASGGGYFVGYTQPGEWLDYTVNVAATGTYTLNFRVASAPVGGKFHLDVDGVNVTGTLSIPSTGNYNTYKTVTKTGVHLTAGTHVLRLMIDSTTPNNAAGNFDWIQAVKV